MITNYLLALVLNVFVLLAFIAFVFITGRTVRLLMGKFDMLNDYMKTIITKYTENVSYSQSVVLLSIFSKAAKYKVYAKISDELLEADSRSLKSGDMLARILITIEVIIRDMRVNLDAFKYEGEYLSSYFLTAQDIDDLNKEISERITSSKLPLPEYKRKSMRLMIIDILNKYFDSVSISNKRKGV